MDRLRKLIEPAVRKVTLGFRLGIEDVRFDTFTIDFDGGDQIDLEPLRQTLDEAMARYADRPDLGDAWLAPRVHAALRLSKRQAADKGVWRYIGLVAAPDFVRWRFGSTDADGNGDPAPLDRFVGADIKHALGRLWWNAELFRNGKDYSPVTMAFEYQDIPNNFTRAALAHHRPTARAFLDVIHGVSEGVSPGDAANALSRAANAAATTLAVDLLAPDEPLDGAARLTWQRDGHDYDARAWFDALPEGPDDGEIPSTSIKTMQTLLVELLAEAPLRDRSRPANHANGTD